MAQLETPHDCPRCSGWPSAGEVFTIIYPFVRDTYQSFDKDGIVEVPTWKPGVRFENVGPEDVGTVADGVGKAAFTVVDVFKPGRFPTRIFFTRKFTNPDGHTFGKGGLHICTLEKFRRLTRGYQHSFGIGEPLVKNRWNARQAEEEFRAILKQYADAGA